MSVEQRRLHDAHAANHDVSPPGSLAAARAHLEQIGAAIAALQSTETRSMGDLHASLWERYEEAKAHVIRLSNQPKAAPSKRKVLIVEYDVTDLTARQIEALTLEAVVQGEASEIDGGHPSVAVLGTVVIDREVAP